MDIGESLISFGLDIRLIQGILNSIYEENSVQHDIHDATFQLNLDQPIIETRDDSAGYRLGIHLHGILQTASDLDHIFDAWVRIIPITYIGDDGYPVGSLQYLEVEEATPTYIAPLIANAFADAGQFGAVLAALRFPLFKPLIERVALVEFPDNQEINSEIVDSFAFSFYLGRPSAIPRPTYYEKCQSNANCKLYLYNTTKVATTCALIASVSLTGHNPTLPNSVSTVRRGTGMQLVIAKTLLDKQLAQTASSQIGSDIGDGVTIQELSLNADDAGINISLNASRSGATVVISGTIAADFYGAKDRGLREGFFLMHPVLKVSVDTSWWVDLLGVILGGIPIIGWIIGDHFIWSPLKKGEEAAPSIASDELSRLFNEALRPVAEQLVSANQLSEMNIMTYLSDVWFFNGNFAVCADAFAGKLKDTIMSITYDVAHVGSDSNHLKTVMSVADITLANGHTLTPWQAGELTKLGILNIPHHHGVSNKAARLGFYLRSNPNHNVSDNLIKEDI